MERRGRPVDGGDARLLHGLEQEHGKGEIFLLKDAAARAERERLVHILAGKIKIKRGLIAEDLIFGIAAEFRHPGREVQDRAVWDDDALRRAGRAGGEEHVDGVDVQNFFAPGPQQRLVRRVLGSLFKRDERRAVRQCAGLRLVCRRMDDRARVDLAEDAAHPRLRHLLVDGDIIAAALQHALHGGDARRSPADHDGHRRIPAAGEAGQHGPERLRVMEHLPVAHGACGVGKRSLVRHARGRTLEVFSNISQRHTVRLLPDGIRIKYF